MSATKITLVILCVAFLIFDSVPAQLVEIPNPQRKAGHCLSREHGIEMRYGEKKSVDGKCTEAYCTYGGEIEYRECDSAEDVDYEKPYPECCPPGECKIVK